ncbi:hypothetical protein OG429_00680 [Streptomyces sp. NBC_00190]|nr:hypothetical protein [Streptomyces sp. NBC_00190]WSZ37994.1 hypothetical protein OG239_03650 [Streptomyces sp. NBC_00868]
MIALVGALEAGGADLGAGRAEEDLGRGRSRLVVDIAAHGDIAGLAVTG